LIKVPQEGNRKSAAGHTSPASIHLLLHKGETHSLPPRKVSTPP
jgi:hypothetical protein